MAIRSDVLTDNVGTKDIAGAITQASSSINDIVGSVKLGSSFKDFAGMDVNDIPTFEAAIDKYRNDINSIIDGFNVDAATDPAFKGEVGAVVREFLVSMQSLIKKYVAVIDIEKAEIKRAGELYRQGEKSISQDLQNDSASIRTKAGSISLD